VCNRPARGRPIADLHKLLEGEPGATVPNAEAVVKSHELMGYLIEATDVIEVASLT
jgi:hypothetical protein